MSHDRIVIAVAFAAIIVLTMGIVVDTRASVAAQPGPVVVVTELLLQGVKHHQQGRHSEAESKFKQALGIDPKCADGTYVRSILDRVGVVGVTDSNSVVPSQRFIF